MYNNIGENMNKLNKMIYIILLIMIIFLSFFIIKDKFIYKDYIKEYNYFNKIEIIKIYTNKNPKKIFYEIDKILKENSNIDIDNNKDYINNIISEYLNKNNIKKYYINIDDTIMLKGMFNVGLPDPYDKYNILKIITVKDKCISTYLDKNKSITVISNNNCQNISITLSKLSIDDGLKIVNNDNSIEALWYIDKKITTSNNFKKYE